jgi:hypothetical protein
VFRLGKYTTLQKHNEAFTRQTRQTASFLSDGPSAANCPHWRSIQSFNPISAAIVFTCASSMSAP